MATLRELIIKISANSQSFQAEIQRASRLGQNYYKTMQDGGRKASSATRETQQALAAVSAQLSETKRAATGLAGAFAGAFATGHLITLADEWNSVNARLKQASTSTEDFSNSQRALMEISQKTGTAFSDNAGLFARSSASMREFGYSSAEVLKVTEAVSTGLKLSGASTAEASSVITQLSQALAQGVLRGEEFNSVNENGDRIIRALAAGMGVARKDLKAMADQGLLTIDKVVPAITSQLQAMQGEFEAMPKALSKRWKTPLCSGLAALTMPMVPPPRWLEVWNRWQAILIPLLPLLVCLPLWAYPATLATGRSSLRRKLSSLSPQEQRKFP
ncbi:tape measure protein [Klebsiella pneumoniae]|nr:tape measure protein [Klebsiella pneumoniae]MDF6052213.1 tape measure protein [Klebsiella pneumoniae]MDF6072375.1 tape measure protein [Klebsiella pneumoniae]MDF6083142.1 tape measure protein [Klebsiella pneumoniae]CAE6209490.1 hypothetical protein AI2644V1_0452 [Klebsiella pneumoniae]CAE6210337.1 hypothetical protein AI2647V1_0452 [Klebsiella pneumoniae]